MNNLSIEILKQLGAFFLKQVDSSQKEIQYLEVKQVQKLYNKQYPARRVTNALYYLLRRKYIQYKKNNGTKKFVLTTQGAMQYFKYCKFVTDIKLKEGVLSLVIIEAPEDRRDLRDFLRRRLKDSGFNRIGRGVYVSDYKIGLELGLFSKLYKLNDIVYFGEFNRR